MPELPDITVYVEALQRHVVGQTLQEIRLKSPFVLRTVMPPYREAQGRSVVGVQRLAKRIAIELEGEMFLVVHLMKLGRLRWVQRGKGPGGKVLLASFVFEDGTLALIEMGHKKRAALHVVAGREAMLQMNPGGLETLDCELAQFSAALRRNNHTLKRALTDPRILSGIGNAYSDEILHAARLSPVKLTSRLTDDEIAALFEATRTTLQSWTQRLREEVGDGFPEKVTAFREGMAVHGRYGQPCPVCDSPVQRIKYADRETNYCATCQTGGRPLADRALSRLLGKDWPKTMEELEELRTGVETKPNETKRASKKGTKARA